MSIKDMELLPGFFEKVKSLCGADGLSDGRRVTALMSDMLPQATDLRRLIKMMYDSGAMVPILQIQKDPSGQQVYRAKSIEKLSEFCFMDKQTAGSVVDAVIASVYPGIKSSSPVVPNPAPNPVSDSAVNSAADEQFRLGMNYYEKQDYVRAVACFRQAAEQGHAGAQYSLGVCYHNGRGVEQDHSQAAYWYRKAAEQGHAGAQNCLGDLYYDYDGRGVEWDWSQAAYWYRKAAEQGHAMAQFNLGSCYTNGRGVEEDWSQRVYWYRKAAEQGHVTAQRGLGGSYDSGRGVEKDHSRAAYWYRKAAEQGDAVAQYCLGACYHRGRGVEQDDSQAVYWYRKAAEQGYAMAQEELNRMRAW